jgi:hypothetical protein
LSLIVRVSCRRLSRSLETKKTSAWGALDFGQAWNKS